MSRPLGRIALAAAFFSLVVLVVWPRSEVLPQHPDEAQYGWSAAYFGGLVARGNFAPAGSDGPTAALDTHVDPGFAPASWWSLTQPMGSRMVYALALAALRLPTPPMPYAFDVPDRHGLEQLLRPRRYARCALWPSHAQPPASPCSSDALGCSPLFAWAFSFGSRSFRKTWRAWAEGPLVLTFGLCAVAAGRRRLPVACGVSVAVKLTGLLLWPLLILLPFTGARRRRLEWASNLGLAIVIWTLLTPPAWFAGGPIYLWTMLVHRAAEEQLQSNTFGTLALPTRYALPFEIGIALLLAWGLQIGAQQLAQMRALRRRRYPATALQP